jgi:hypothetical protein
MAVADKVMLDFDEWHEHARWWDAEGPRVREQLSVDPATLARARSMFGKIGSSTVGAALNAPLAPVDQGTGVGEILASSGPTWPPGALDPAAPAGSLVDAFPDTAAAVVPQVVPAIIGGVVGGVGGVLGGLAGTGQRALQGMQQAAAPMMSELGQHPAGGGSPEGGERSSSPAESPSSGDAKPPSDSGGAVGDTEPAWAPGPLSAPTSVAAAPAIAAPASVSPPAGTLAETSAPALGAMGPMMAPPMGAPRSGNSGDAQRERLYQERQLKVVAPPNSEPVKGRREGRDRTRGTDRKA